jgi:hypothetical protein
MPIRGTRAMTSADAMRALLASRVLPVWKGRSTRTEWMGAPFPGRNKSPVVESKGLEGGNMSGKVAPLVPSQETPPSCRLGGRVCCRPEDWAPVDHCAGQFDDEALYVDFCQPLAVSEPTLTRAKASPEEMAEPTTYTLSHLDRLRRPSMTVVWGRVSTWPLELVTVSSTKPCRPQVPQIWQASTFLSVEPCRPRVPQIRQASTFSLAELC